MGTIPSITHQIWLQGWEQLPEKFRENTDLLRSKNPHWRHMTWDETSLRAECEKLGKEYVAKFDSFDLLTLKVDYGRYVVLYNHGGISIDTDMKALKPIDTTPHLRDSQLIVSSAAFPASLQGLPNNALLLCCPGHPVLKEMIDRITFSEKTAKDYLTKELYISGTTGPTFLKEIVDEFREQFIVLEHTFYEPCFSVDPYCRPQENTIMDHQHEMHWIGEGWKTVFRGLFYIWYHLGFVVILGLVLGGVAAFFWKGTRGRLNVPSRSR